MTTDERLERLERMLAKLIDGGATEQNKKPTAQAKSPGALEKARGGVSRADFYNGLLYITDRGGKKYKDSQDYVRPFERDRDPWTVPLDVLFCYSEAARVSINDILKNDYQITGRVRCGAYLKAVENYLQNKGGKNK